MLSQTEKKELLLICRESLICFLKDKQVYPAKAKSRRLKQKQALFVSLKRGKDLCGCVGCLEARKPLYLEARDMAIAACKDSRFRPIAKEELNQIKIEAALLSPLSEISDAADFVLGKQGVVVSKGSNLGVFLPQVAVETGWDKKEFLSRLCQDKAGIEPDAWQKKTCRMFAFSVEVIS